MRLKWLLCSFAYHIDLYLKFCYDSTTDQSYPDKQSEAMTVQTGIYKSEGNEYMMLLHVLYSYAFNNSQFHNIISRDIPPKHIGIEKEAIRFFRSGVIGCDERKIIDSVQLVPVEGNVFHIKFSNGEYLCRDSLWGKGVKTCNVYDKFIDWVFEPLSKTNGYTIQQNGDCITVHTYDTASDGHNIQMRRCRESVHQIFDIMQVEKAQIQTKKVVTSVVIKDDNTKVINKCDQDNANSAIYEYRSGGENYLSNDCDENSKRITIARNRNGDEGKLTDKFGENCKKATLIRHLSGDKSDLRDTCDENVKITSIKDVNNDDLKDTTDENVIKITSVRHINGKKIMTTSDSDKNNGKYTAIRYIEDPPCKTISLGNDENTNTTHVVKNNGKTTKIYKNNGKIVEEKFISAKEEDYLNKKPCEIVGWTQPALVRTKVQDCKPAKDIYKK